MGKELKKFRLDVEIQPSNTPQHWSFDNINPIEQLAIWLIVKNLAERNIKKALNAEVE